MLALCFTTNIKQNVRTDFDIQRLMRPFNAVDVAFPSVTSSGDYRVATLQYKALLSSSGDFTAARPSGDFLQGCFSYVITTSSYSSFWERMTLFSYGAYLLLSRFCLCTLSFEYVSILDTSFSLCSFLIIYSFSYF